jgi:hypothetical protein
MDPESNVIVVDNNPHHVHHVPVVINHKHDHSHSDSHHSKIPVISTTWAILILILNIFLPGWGTVALLCFSTHHKLYFLLLGLLQFLLLCLIIGWVWAIITSVQVLKKSDDRGIL